jgi:type III pantothenate kinase
MNLCIDVGNTRVKLAIFDSKGILLELQVYDNLDRSILQSIIKKFACTNAIISSVRGNHTGEQLFLKQKVTNLYCLTADLPVPIQNRYKTPQTLGKDRLAAIVGATVLIPNQNILVVDAGTCITYDFITKRSEYLGGSILPGIVMRFKSMAHFTAKLPLIEKEELDSFIGTTTKTSMQTGVMQGVLHELIGFKMQYQEKFGNINVIVTGGDASYFESQLKNEIFAQPNLVLVGLNRILDYNIQ